MYTIDKDGKSITCHECGMTSYNKTDIEQRYCGHCHKFHGDHIDTSDIPEVGEEFFKSAKLKLPE